MENSLLSLTLFSRAMDETEQHNLNDAVGAVQNEQVDHGMVKLNVLQ
jgi:hypothetical protein